jgi:hypothetical protein
VHTNAVNNLCEGIQFCLYSLCGGVSGGYESVKFVGCRHELSHEMYVLCDFIDLNGLGL